MLPLEGVFALGKHGLGGVREFSRTESGSLSSLIYMHACR